MIEQSYIGHVASGDTPSQQKFAVESKKNHKSTFVSDWKQKHYLLIPCADFAELSLDMKPDMTALSEMILLNDATQHTFGIALIPGQF